MGAMKRYAIFWTRAVGIVATLTLLMAATGIGAPVVAQEDGEQYRLVISTTSCEDFPVTSETSCEPTVGARFTVTTEGGEPLGNCTTEQPRPNSTSAACMVLLPFETTVVVFEEPSTIPEGYTPVENPQVYDTPPTLAGGGVPPDIAFVNVLVDDHSDLVEQLVQLLIDALRSVLG